MSKKEELFKKKLAKAKTFEEYQDAYYHLQKENPDNICYCSDYYSFLIEHYERSEEKSPIEILTELLDNIKESKYKYPKHSRFLVFEVRVMIELIKNSPLKYMQIFNDEELMKRLNDAIAINPNNFHAYIVRGKIHEANQERDAAELDYNKALSLSPKSYNFLFLLEKALNNQLDGKIDDAIDDYLFIEKNETDKSLLTIAYQKLIALYTKKDMVDEKIYYENCLKKIKQ